MEVYVGIDPSYSRTGIAIYSDGNLFLTKVVKEEATEKDYQSMFVRTQKMVSRIIHAISINGKPTSIISEEPLPNSNFSSGLFALDTLLFDRIIRDVEPQTILNVHPTYLGFIHKKKHYAKSESVTLAKGLIAELEKVGVNVMYDGRFAHDTAEALIFLSRLIVLKDVELGDKRLSEAIISFNDRFAVQKEKVLC